MSEQMVTRTAQEIIGKRKAGRGVYRVETWVRSDRGPSVYVTSVRVR